MGSMDESDEGALITNCLDEVGGTPRRSALADRKRRLCPRSKIKSTHEEQSLEICSCTVAAG